ncbi:Protein Wnt-5 [Folsomia candida]|uniref:Protein Wnt-5 n=1 Tax=Folsomia candida TaxID=158441 RepID=A0A226DIB1_FOLCA|nr:Protein Wnt-5 [Folsomia candida]
MTPECDRGPASENDVYCESGDALIGVSMDVENHSNYIKTSRIYCSRWIISKTGNETGQEIKLVEPLYLRNMTRSRTIKGGHDAVGGTMGKSPTSIVAHPFPRPEGHELNLILTTPAGAVECGPISPMLDLDRELKVISTMTKTGFDYVDSFWRYPAYGGRSDGQNDHNK